MSGEVTVVDGEEAEEVLQTPTPIPMVATVATPPPSVVGVVVDGEEAEEETPQTPIKPAEPATAPAPSPPTTAPVPAEPTPQADDSLQPPLAPVLPPQPQKPQQPTKPVDRKTAERNAALWRAFAGKWSTLLGQLSREIAQNSAALASTLATAQSAAGHIRAANSDMQRLLTLCTPAP